MSINVLVGLPNAKFNLKFRIKYGLEVADCLEVGSGMTDVAEYFSIEKLLGSGVEYARYK